MAIFLSTPLAPPGSTGNNSHQSVMVSPVAQLIAVEFVSEVAGTTITGQLQGTFDPGTVADGSANWFALMVLPSDSETAATTWVRTTLGATAVYLAQSTVRFVPRVRLVTSANTGVTYRANLRSMYRNQ